MTEDLQKQHLDAARRVGPVWDAARARRIRAGVSRKHRRFVVARASAVALACALLLTAGAVWWSSVGTEAEVELAAAPTVVEFGDGSRALSDRASDLVVEGSTPREISVRLRAGRSRFEVSESQSRQFVVRAAGVTVTVSGTEFTVQHVEDGVRVEVHAGSARIESAGGRMELTAGNHAVFATSPGAPSRESADLGHGPKTDDGQGEAALAANGVDQGPQGDPVAADAGAVADSVADPHSKVEKETPVVDGPPAVADKQGPAPGAGTKGESKAAIALRSRAVEGRRQGGKRPPTAGPVAPKAGEDWRALAKAGDVKAAAAALVPPSRLTRVDDLMRAADVMRHAGRHAEAIPYLERVERRFASSPQASLAAFQRARILLRTGGSCRAAALFAKAGSTTARPSLREDALAREVQAWSRCGQKDRARARAQKYVDRYPGGHFLRTVRKHGGL